MSKLQDVLDNQTNSIDDLIKFKQFIKELAMNEIDIQSQRPHGLSDKLLLFYLAEIMDELIVLKQVLRESIS